jgi:hypothetical protein
MDDEAKIQAQARREAGLQATALAVLLARAGGKATYTQAEYRELAERYGGFTSLGIHIELSHDAAGEATVEISLIRKDPGQGSLVS